MVIIFLFISTLICQVVPFETTSIKSIDQDIHNKIYISDTMIGAPLDINLVELSTISSSGEDIYIESVISMETLRTIRLEANHAGLPAGSRFFLIDPDENAVIGPLHIQEGINKIDLGPIYSSHFIIQCIIPKTLLSSDYSITISDISDLSSVKINQNKEYHPKISNREKFGGTTKKRENNFFPNVFSTKRESVQLIRVWLKKH